MRVTLQGRYTGHELCRTTNGSVVESSSSRVGYTSSGSYVRCYVPGGGEAFDDTLRGTLSDAAVTLRLTVATESATTSGGIRVDVNGSQVWNSLEPAGTMECIETRRHVVKSVESGDLFGKYPEELEYTITGSAAVTGMLEYGFSLVATGQNNAWLVYDAVLEVTGESSEAPPVIAVDTGYMQGVYQDGVYYHPAGDTDFYAGITYSQDLDVPMSVMRYAVKDRAGAVLYAGETTALSFLFPRTYWREIPAAGTIEFTAVSTHGLPSTVLSMPWVIAHMDVSPVSPVSGSILDTSADLVMTWEAVLPAGMPSAPKPTGYTVWPAWDNEAGFTTAYAVSGTSYTIPADSFAGHKKLRLLILEEYADGAVVRRQGDGCLVQLYLQPTSALSGVTVSPAPDAQGNYNPVLTLSWTSEGQTAYQVMVDDYDSGAVWGNGTTYAIPMVLDDGIHTIRMRIQDASVRWGAWSEPLYISVKNAVSLYSAAVMAVPVERGVRLDIEGGSTALQYADVLVYRDGVLIAQLPGTETMRYAYEDRYAAGTVRYKVRFVRSSGNYTETPEIEVNAVPETDGMILPDGTWFPLRYTPDFPRRYQITTGEETYHRHYAGRGMPVSVRSGRKTRKVDMEYIEKGGRAFDRLEAEGGSVVIYKTVLGHVIPGELNQIRVESNPNWSRCSFRLTEVRHEDSILYDRGVVAVSV